MAIFMIGFYAVCRPHLSYKGKQGPSPLVLPTCPHLSYPLVLETFTESVTMAR